LSTLNQSKPDMKPVFDPRSKRHWIKATGQCGAGIFALFLGLGAAQAGSTNFVGEFAPPLWTLQSGQGSVFFTNGNTELVLTGPNQPPAEVNPSLDGITYNGPLPGGLRVGGTVEFHWDYNPGAVNSASVDFAWTPPGGGSSVDVPLISDGGLGIESGDFSTNLAAGTVFEFLLTTDTLADKLSGTLVISDFQFHADVPEPSSRVLLAVALLCFGAARWRRS
jgi:hypothetical protein